MKNNIDDSVNLCSPSPDVDGVSDSPYMSSNHQTDGQPEVGRGLPSIDDATEKSGVNKDKISGSDKQGDRNVEIIDVNMEVEQWYSIANLIYVLLVGYVWVRYMMGNPASGNVLRLIDSIFIWMALWIPHAVKVEPLKAKLPIWFVWLAAIAALFALAIVGVAR